MTATIPDGSIRVRATVTVELVAPSLDDVSDLLHETWSAGDTDDTLNACIVLGDAREVDRFSWENAS